MSQSIRSSGEN